ncbi:DNA topoisomerase 2-beta [Holothuria leucospilota]|uniref:DNA topoisomerase 2 n=1 Tax=Holothuria leucospilota TaxID=206669 RepID=A0A9Q0YBK8_HOLLE|nr:DNA topoisomerase 2-beta [Holothuria leucospilota]
MASSDTKKEVGGGLQWVTLFDQQANKLENQDDDGPKEKKPKEGKDGKKNKRLSVERIYQKKTQLEHILLRPDTYIGSVEPVTQTMWVVEEDGGLVNREVTFVPGLYKIFDEILVNASDNKQRDPDMNCIKITIDPENNVISVWNNGKGIPVIEHQKEKMFVPEMIFGHLLTSSNFDDTQKKVTGGRNGYGAKLCNVFSTKFTVITANKEYKKKFKQTWTNNMSKKTDPKISEFSGSDFTEITFSPDLEKFKMTVLDKDTVALLTRRAYDVAGVTKGVKVYLNGTKLPVSSFKSYCELYLKDKTMDDGAPLKIAHEVVNDRWEVCLTISEKGFQQVSFVNSIATTKGGRHVDYICEQVVSKLMDTVKKKNKGGVNIKPFQLKNHVWLFVNCLVENPTFDSQTKENMTLQAKKFGSTASLSEKFLKGVTSCGIVDSVTTWMKFKQQSELQKKCHSSKHSKLKGIPKLDDANDAGTRFSRDCTLILTEGDSAKSLAVSGLGVIGRDRYGVFPLRGKLLNVREASHKQIMDNAEINNIVKIVGLQYKNKYETEDSLKTLRYGKVMIMTDQDQDGSHIKGLLINFIQYNWPNLLKYHFVEQFITPIVKVSKQKESLSFYSIPEFEEWMRDTENWRQWKAKYYKGLGTSTMKEAKDYFSDMNRHRILFDYHGADDDAAIELAFSKKKVEDRKEWLTSWLEERKRRKEAGLSDIYLYGKDTKRVSFNDFINKELVLFSNADNERSIPSAVDGLKPGQRKVLFTAFKKYENKEIKVAQMAGAVAELSAYHHGEASLMSTIINLAQNFVGSNNINLLQPIGQFGTRLHGGKDAASPRYIFTTLSPLTRILFNHCDDNLVAYQYDDNQKVEPVWYCPIIPMVLVNGSDGIGTGWSTRIPNYGARDIVKNIKRMLQGEEIVPMIPSYKGFIGTIEEIEPNRFAVSGEIAVVDDNTIEITELPIRTWTQTYKEQVLEPMLHGTDKTPPLIQDYKEYHTDTTVKFVIQMAADKLLRAEQEGLHKVFKIQTTISQANQMVLYDAAGCIKRYDSVEEIFREFYTLRLEFYQKRKDFLEGMLTAESSRLNNQARFILEKIEGTLIVENKTRKEMIKLLVHKGYDSDPVKAWKEATQKELDPDAESAGEEEDVDSIATSASGGGPDFNYLLGMAMWSLTKEKKDQLLKQRDAKAQELADIRRKTPSMLWNSDLDTFLKSLEELEAQEIADMEAPIELAVPENAKGKKGRVTKKKKKVVTQEETKPSPFARRVVPRIDPSMKAKKATGGSRSRKPKAALAEDVKEVEIKEEPSEPLSLAERLAAKTKNGDQTGVSKTMKQSKLGFKPKKKASPKKAKKRNPWSDSGEDTDYGNSDDDDDFKLEARAAPPPRRAAAAKVKYSTNSDSEDDEDFLSKPADDDEDFQMSGGDQENDPDDSFIAPAKKSKAHTKNVISSDEESEKPSSQENDVVMVESSPVKEPVKRKLGSSDSESEKPAAAAPAAAKPKKKAVPKKKAKASTTDSDEVPKKPKAKKVAKKPVKPKKKVNFSDSDDSEPFVGDEDAEVVPRADRGRRGRAPVQYKFQDDSEDDDDY